MAQVYIDETNQEIDDNVGQDELNYRYEISSYGADYPTDTIVKRIDGEIIYVPPFQRNYVWDINRASKFIESLILGLPVPGVFLCKEANTGRLLIVDGQQRMMSIYKFYKGEFKEGVPFVLTGITSDLAGKSYETLSAEDKIRLDDAIIHTTIIKQEEPDDEESGIYLVFERLNTGGKALTPQEVRACIYYGGFNDLLNELTENQVWRSFFRTRNDRLKEQELILRFFALFYERDEYTSPLKGFLNTFMAKNRNFQIYPQEQLTTIFEETINRFNQIIGNRPFRKNNYFNAAIYDSAMVAMADKIVARDELDNDDLLRKYDALINDPVYIGLISGSTAGNQSVTDRIAIAKRIFD